MFSEVVSSARYRLELFWPFVVTCGTVELLLMLMRMKMKMMMLITMNYRNDQVGIRREDAIKRKK